MPANVALLCYCTIITALITDAGPSACVRICSRSSAAAATLSAGSGRDPRQSCQFYRHALLPSAWLALFTPSLPLSPSAVICGPTEPTVYGAFLEGESPRALSFCLTRFFSLAQICALSLFRFTARLADDGTLRYHLRFTVRLRSLPARTYV